jgi:NADPH-dependent 2,4-dienoyl-CoA reductase/sulfur reductase-like enzyme
MTAASQARRMRSGDELEIVAFERGQRTSYAACGLPYLLEGLVERPDDLIARTPEEFIERGIDVHIGHDVIAIDTSERSVVVRDLAAGTQRTESWDELVIATGASGITPPLAGIDSDGVFQLRTLDDAAAIEARITGGARNAVVVGAGYIGLEVAEALNARGLSVTMLEMAESPMAGTLDSDMAEKVTAAVGSSGVDLRLGTAVTGFDHTDGQLTAVVTGDSSFPADIAVLGLGVKPNSDLAAAAGIAVGPTGGIVTDERMHTAAEGVWAGGDCVESTHRITGQPVVIALGTHANKHGRVIGTNLGGGMATFPGVIGTAITKFGELEIGRTGLGEAEAERAGIDVSVSTVTSQTRAHYYPDSTPVTVKTVVRRSDGVLVGSQVLGGPGAGKRIDALATAIWAGMTVEDLSMADLSYAPPFSPVWDPVVFAAGVADKLLRR